MNTKKKYTRLVDECSQLRSLQVVVPSKASCNYKWATCPRKGLMPIDAWCPRKESTGELYQISRDFSKKL